MLRFLGPFVALLRHPGASVLAFFGLLGRAPVSMLSVALVAAAGSTGGSAGYALGGTAAGAYAIASAVTGPPLGRLVDRRGQRTVARVLALVAAVAAVLIVLSLIQVGPTPVIVLLAAVAGGSQPQVGSYARARWAALLGTTPAAETAQALESINDEISFLIGPSLAAILATVGFVGLPIAVAVACMLIGVLGMTSARSVAAPPVHAPEPGESHWPGFPAGRGLLVGSAALGLCLGSVQVLQLAYCRTLGDGGGAALVFFVYSLASLVGALLVGGIAWSAGVRRRFSVSLLVYALGVLPTALVGGYGPFVVSAALAGVAIAPTFIQANAVVAGETPIRERTGAFALLGSATVLGIAAGSAISGNAIELLGADHARLVVIPMAALIALVAVSLALHADRTAAVGAAQEGGEGAISSPR